MVKEKVPIADKLLLTIDEASEYSNIGINKIRSLASVPNCKFTLYIGRKCLIKRKEFEKFIENAIEI